MDSTLPKPNNAPENGWLDDDRFLMGPGICAAMFVSGRVRERIIGRNLQQHAALLCSLLWQESRRMWKRWSYFVLDLAETRGWPGICCHGGHDGPFHEVNELYNRNGGPHENPKMLKLKILSFLTPRSVSDGFGKIQRTHGNPAWNPCGRFRSGSQNRWWQELGLFGTKSDQVGVSKNMGKPPNHSF